MKYMIMIYANPQTWGHPTFLHTSEAAALSPAERDRLGSDFEDFLGEIAQSGELVEGVPLADPATARTVRVRDGAELTTDGPFIEVKEQLAGYFIVDCESLERATAIAARFPDVKAGAVEVRAIMGSSGEEM